MPLALVQHLASGQTVSDSRYSFRHDDDGWLNPLTLPLRLPGQYYDEETGLHYNYFRDYNPASGRYVDSDPVGLRGGVNKYAYVIENPVSVMDPLGLLTTQITTSDLGVGSHSALFVHTPGQDPFLYDPAGSYQPKSGEPRGSGDFFEGKDASLSDYIQYQQSTGSGVKATFIPTTPEQEAAIKQRAMDHGWRQSWRVRKQSIRCIGWCLRNKA